MQTTKNYNLNKPDINDAVDITKLNENADKIDAELKKMSETIPAGLENAVIATDEMPTDPLPREADKLGGHEASYFATAEQLTSCNTLISNYSSYASGKDGNGIYTVVDYKRADATLYMKSTLSGGTSPKYTTDTWKFYDALGTTIIKTITWTLSYDGDGKIISKVVA